MPRVDDGDEMCDVGTVWRSVGPPNSPEHSERRSVGISSRAGMQSNPTALDLTRNSRTCGLQLPSSAPSDLVHRAPAAQFPEGLNQEIP